MNVDLEQAKAIFLDALEKTSAEERSVFLDEVCGDDQALRSHVDLLLEAHQQPGSFLEKGALVPGPTAVQSADQGIVEKGGSRIGPYKLLQQIGEGGMGVVYMAEQTKPVERRVALKIIKPGMDTRHVIARFEAERQALAMMDHPNIARVLDVGTTASGRPFFAMELVKGVPITQYCDEHRLTVRERLELFAEICHAVQHAHQKGIIHRDIKPSNVLVAEYDDHAVPKIIDFGLAKAMQQRLTEKTMFTLMGQVVGTLEYMSPEQAKLNQLDIDTRSDIYSLGVLLYELLTGETPFDRQRLRSAAFDEILRILREEEPPRPSLRVGTSESLPSIAANRHVEPKKLSVLVRGELDWIVMKAMEKDRSRRYETANGFAADIERFLIDEPVQACPPSAAYRFRKFSRRNKAPLAVAFAATLALVVVTIGSLVAAGRFLALAQHNAELVVEKHDALTAETQAKKAAHASRRDAEIARDQEAVLREEAQRQTQLAQDALTDAQKQRGRAEANFALARSAVDEFLNDVTENELLTVPGLQPLRHKLLSSAMEFFDEFTNDEANASELLVELASAHHRIAVIRGELGQQAESQAANEKSIQLFEQLRGNGNDSLEVRLGLAQSYRRADRLDDTVKLCQEILDTEATEAETRSLLAGTYNALALADKNNKDLGPALNYHQQALALREQLVRDFPDNAKYLAELGGTVNNLGVLLARQKRMREALAMFERSIGYAAEAYSKSPETILWGRWLAISLRNVAFKHANFGNHEDALTAFRRLVTVRRRLAFENPAVPSLKGELYKAWLDLGNHQKQYGGGKAAGRSFRAAQEVLEHIPRETPSELFELAIVYGALAQPAEGSIDPTPDELDDQARYAKLAMDTIAKAVKDGFQDVESLKTNKHLASLRDRDDFGQLVASLEKQAEAEKLATGKTGTDRQKLTDRRQAVGLLKKLVGDDPDEVRHRKTLAATIYSIGEIQIGLGQFTEAEQSLQEALQMRRELAGENDPSSTIDVLTTRYSLGNLHWQSGRHAEAYQVWQQLMDELEKFSAAHQDSDEIDQSVAHIEREICNAYGRLGLWDLTAQHSIRNVQLGRVLDRNRDAWGTAVLPLVGRADDYRAYSQLLAERLRQSETEGRKWKPWELASLAFQSSLVADSGVPAERMVSIARQAVDAEPDTEWLKLALVMSLHRNGQSQDALDISQQHPFGSGDVPSSSKNRHWLVCAYLRTMAHLAVDQPDQALRVFSAAEQCYEQYCKDVLENSDRFPKFWWWFAFPQQLRREAWHKVHGEPAPDDAWQHLIQARGYRLIGEQTKADTELTAAVATAPDDLDVRMARARMFEQWDEMERSTEAEWQRVVDLAGEHDPMPWIHRGRWYAQRGGQETADADFAKAASLTPNELNKFLEAGWWVVGPYPSQLDEFCPPELDPDPSSPVYAIDSDKGLSDTPVAWRPIGLDGSGRIDVSGNIRVANSSSFYLLSYVYAPSQRTATLRTNKEFPARIWVNGAACPTIEPAFSGGFLSRKFFFTPLTLKQGRNTILVKLECSSRSKPFTLRLNDHPLERAFDFARAGLLDEAGELLATGFAKAPGEDWRWLASKYDIGLRHQPQTHHAIARYLLAHNAPEAIRYNAMTPDCPLDAELLSAFADERNTQELLSEHPYWRRSLGLIYLRADRCEDALAVMNNEDPSLHPIRAISHHRLGHHERARELLAESVAKLEANVDAARRDRNFAKASLSLSRHYTHAREAHALIAGNTEPVDRLYEQFHQIRRELWEARDPATEAYDDLEIITRENKDPRPYIARGRRLVELERFDEAEADFDKAVGLAPDDYRPRLARAEFHAPRGRISDAADDFRWALDLAKGQRPYVEAAIRRHMAVLDELQNREPQRSACWRMRGARAVVLNDWDEAARCFSIGDKTTCLELVAVRAIQQDAAGHESAYQIFAHDWLPENIDDSSTDWSYWQPLALGLVPLKAEKVAEMMRLAQSAYQANPNSSGYQFILGLAHYRAGQYDQALELLEKSAVVSDWLYQRASPRWAVLAMTLARLDRAEEARHWLQRTAVLSGLMRRQVDRAAQGDNNAGNGLGNSPWLIAYALTREAERLIDGPEALALEDAREATRHVDRGRSTLARAEADWQKVVELAGDDPMPWIHRGRWYAQRGEQEKADADFAKAASLTPNELNKFLQAGWWVVGPYPAGLEEFCPPELDPDPSKPVYVIDPETGVSDEPVRWQTLPVGQRSGIPSPPGIQDDRSCYAMTFVCSPDERTERIDVRTNSTLRIWVNGRRLADVSKSSSVPQQLPTTLHPGRNVILVKFPHRTFASVQLGDAPTARAYSHARHGQWDQAADLVAGPAFEHLRWSINEWSLFSSLLLLDDVHEDHREQLDILYQNDLRTYDGYRLAHASAVSPHAIPGARSAKLVRLLRNHLKTRDPNDGHYSNALIALALIQYRCGNLDDASQILSGVEHAIPSLHPVQALIAHARGAADEAEAALKNAVDYARGENSLDGSSVTNVTRAYDFAVLLREAEGTIRRTTTEADALLARWKIKAQNRLQRLEPQTAAYDAVIDFSAGLAPEPYIARGRRLVELGRFEEAQADFNRAVELRPDDPQLLATRAEIYAEAGQTDKAAADFDAALTLTGTSLSAAAISFIDMIPRFPEVFDAVLQLRADDYRLWFARGNWHAYHQRWDQARDDYDRAMSARGEPLHPTLLVHNACVRLLLEDDEGYLRIRGRADDLSGRAIVHRVRIYALAKNAVGFPDTVIDDAKRLAQERGGFWTEFALGLSYYRKGMFEEAVKLLHELQGPSQTWEERMMNWSVIAMAQHRLGLADELRRSLRALDFAQDVSSRSLRVRPPSSSTNWLMAQVLYREAKQLIEGQ